MHFSLGLGLSLVCETKLWPKSAFDGQKSYFTIFKQLKKLQ